MRNIDNPIATLPDVAREAASQAEKLIATNTDYRERLEKAQALILELESTVAELGTALSVANVKLKEQYAAATEMVKQNDQLLPAARRYTWLRDAASDKVPMVEGRLLGGNKLDAYIDEQVNE